MIKFAYVFAAAALLAGPVWAEEMKGTGNTPVSTNQSSMSTSTGTHTMASKGAKKPMKKASMKKPKSATKKAQ